MKIRRRSQVHVDLYDTLKRRTELCQSLLKSRQAVPGLDSYDRVTGESRMHGSENIPCPEGSGGGSARSIRPLLLNEVPRLTRDARQSLWVSISS